MGRHSQRKRPHANHDRDNPHDFGLADTLHDVKRRRLSNETSGATSHNGHHRDESKVTKNDEDGWTTVSSKSAARHDKRYQKSLNNGRSYPEINFSRKVVKPVAIEQLRDLALYVLADGVGPDWVAINNSRAIAKVVAMMIPGFDEPTLQRASELVNKLRAHKDANTSKVNGSSNDDLAAHAVNDDSTNNGSALLDEFDDLNQIYSHDWFLKDTFPARAPGDGKYHKVHSPLQAMLMTPEVPDKKKPKQSESKFKPVLTPITHFIHTSDELREAEYPIHPATFNSAADAALEATRRERTEQSISAGWVDSNVSRSTPLTTSDAGTQPLNEISQGLDICAIDCEMVLTNDQKSSLARISIVSWPDGKVILDKFVKPDLPIENYFTQYSGITPAILANVTTTLADIQQDLLRILTPSTVLLGHSLESDLNAMKTTHPFIIDTSMLYPHPRGLPLRSSLKFLANKYLRREIQTGGADGHDSVEDAKAVLDLVKLKCEKGPKFGTPEANGEPIFKRLSRHKRKDGKPLTSAIIEYGSSPERGFGKDATYAIGCQDDQEITAGMLRGINGDGDGKEIPSGGADFVWGRLRTLEFAKGWVQQANANPNTSTPNTVSSKPESTDTDTAAPSDGEPSQDDLDKAILTTLRHVAQIHNALPPSTLLIIYSGTSDVRPMLKLQAMQQQYRKEFKVKKWDELSVRWTDVEEQALRNAAEQARLGWAYVGISNIKKQANETIELGGSSKL